MSIWKILGWGVSAFFVLVPFNWFRLWLIEDFPKAPNGLGAVLILTIIMWAIGAAIAYCLIWWSRRQAIQKAEATAELELFMTQPLQQVQPQTALLRPNEKAYATIQGELKETKTVGYSAGTAGVSVRVAKGVTLRTGGIKGGAMKGLVSVAAGELVITDQRIIFAGDRKSFAVANEDLLNTTNYADGFSFTDGKTTYTISTRSGKAHTTFAMVLHRILRNKTA